MVAFNQISLHLQYLLLSTILGASLVAAQPTLRTRQRTPELSDSENAKPGSIDYVGEGTELEGAVGESRGSVNLSTGGQVAIIVIVVVVVVLGVGSAVLYYFAKKRQWEVRASIRRSARRVAESIKSPITGTAPQWPRTPRTPRAPRPGTQTSGTDAPRSKPSILKDASHQSSKPHPSTKVTKKGEDVEKGLSKSTSADSDSKVPDLPRWKKVFR